jgi:hypothetical protein
MVEKMEGKEREREAKGGYIGRVIGHCRGCIARKREAKKS